jgi:thymidylate kinase
MKILIVEGIPTSGKSSLIKNISKLLKENKVVVFGEPNTHIPIMDEPEGLHIEFFKSLLQQAVKSKADLVIFDRFHFTQALRAKASISNYSEIEDLLAKQKTLVVYLQVDDSAIANRIRLTSERRDKDPAEHFQWGEYFKKKGNSFEEIAKHYAAQQQDQMELLKQSKLPSRIFNTTHHEYKTIANQIINEWLIQN